MKTAITTAPKPTATKPALKPGLLKLDLGALAPKKSASTTDYPVLDDPTGDIAKLAEDIRNENEEFEALKGSLEAKKAELRRLAIMQYFPLYKGRGEIQSSLSALTKDGREVLIAFINKYPVLDDESTLSPILGEDRLGLLEQKLTFKIEGKEIPDDRMSGIYQGLVALFTEHDCLPALSAKQGVGPTKDFHTLRHTQLTIEENVAFDLACPVQAQVKTKGREKKK